MQKIAQAEHIDPFLVSFIDKSTQVPSTKRKRKSKKRRTKDGADNTLDNCNNYFERTAKMENERPLPQLLDTAPTLNDDSSGCAKNVDLPPYGSETSYQLTAPKTEIPGERKENTSADLDEDRENIF